MRFSVKAVAVGGGGGGGGAPTAPATTSTVLPAEICMSGLRTEIVNLKGAVAEMVACKRLGLMNFTIMLRLYQFGFFSP